MAMRVRGDALEAHTDIDLSQIGPASRLVARLTGYPVPPNKAIVGANAFAHEAGIHQDGLLKDVGTYQIIDPAELGLEMTLPLGKHSGRHAFSRACEAAGLDPRRRSARPGVRTFQGACRRGPRRLHPRTRAGGDRVVTTYSIACLAGDGIGQEVMAQASRGMREASRLHGFALDERHVAFGADATMRFGHPSRPRRETQRWTPTRSSPPPSTSRCS